MADLAAAYALATAKGGAPSGHDLVALAAWCAARGGAGLTSAVAVNTFINNYSGAGSASYNTPGTYSFTIPYHATFSAVVYGAGGGGGGIATDGSGGGYSQFAGTLTGYGGGGGQVAPGGSGTGATGTAGTASGGSATTGGGVGGGAGAYNNYGSGKDFPGYDQFGGTGGPGGLSSYTWSVGTWTPGSTVTIIVGAGGAPGTGTYNHYPANAGSDGAVYLSWT